MTKEFLISDIEEYTLVSSYLKDQDHSKVICFRGELGAGKTCLVQNLCTQLGCDEKASSPTFTIVNEYRYPEGGVYHFDLYRMNEVEEVIDIGIDEYLYSGYYCFFEWPELIVDVLLDKYVDVMITVEADNSRKVLISNISQ